MSLQPKLNLKENCKFTKKDLHNLRIFYFNYEDRFDENSLYGFIQFDLIRFIKINPCPCFPLHCLLASNSSFFSILINPEVHRKTPVLESLCNRVAGLQGCNLIKRKNIANF